MNSHIDLHAAVSDKENKALTEYPKIAVEEDRKAAKEANAKTPSTGAEKDEGGSEEGKDWDNVAGDTEADGKEHGDSRVEKDKEAKGRASVSGTEDPVRFLFVP